ncbi:MAG: hypothetical protein D6744_18280 [Planctomycetota bacterium]|nr:MAG: hypothetical protein D6744_18280 [Planctomycetota bacterium]
MIDRARALLAAGDELTLAIIAAAGVVIVLTILARIFAGARQRAADRRFARQQRERRRAMQELREATARAAASIVATSSTDAIAGYRIVRQIEAVFTDNHPNAERAVETLKALAAAKGANALINLAGERTATGKCAARGDAVVVQPLDTPVYDVAVDVAPASDGRVPQDAPLLPQEAGDDRWPPPDETAEQDARDATDADDPERPLTFLRFAKERLTGKRKRRRQ